MTTLLGFVQCNVERGTHILTDGWRGYGNLIMSGYKRTPHGVSKKHPPRYIREWNYRFNRRNGSTLDWVLARMATKPGIEYKALVAQGGTLSFSFRNDHFTDDCFHLFSDGTSLNPSPVSMA